MRHSIYILAVIGIMMPSAVWGGHNLITLHGSNMDIQVRGTDDKVVFQPFTFNTLPDSGGITIMGKNASAKCQYYLSDSSLQVFDTQFSLGAQSNKSSFGQVHGQFRFTPTVDLIYQLSGNYSWSGDWANGVSLFARIKEIDTQNDITLHYYDSAGVLSYVNLQIGKAYGNVTNKIGPKSGTLQAGTAYIFELVMATDNNQYSPEVGQGTGQIKIEFSRAPCKYLVQGDFNDDCVVDLVDFMIFSNNWLTNCYLTPGDPKCILK